MIGPRLRKTHRRICTMVANLSTGQSRPAHNMQYEECPSYLWMSSNSAFGKYWHVHMTVDCMYILPHTRLVKLIEPHV